MNNETKNILSEIKNNVCEIKATVISEEEHKELQKKIFDEEV